METLQANSRAKEVLLSAFPSYRGRKFHVREIHFPMSLSSYWDGGSRSDYAIVSLAARVGSHGAEETRLALVFSRPLLAQAPQLGHQFIRQEASAA
jgi:hypothetical protein